MNNQNSESLTIFAPAKINLFLHILGKRNDGYHELESLVSFVDIGDNVTITPSQRTEFIVDGPFSKSFTEKELDSNPHSKNLVMKALWGLSRLYNRAPSFRIHLEKNLPLAAGIGGGSADAAALIWGITKKWGIFEDNDEFDAFMLGLGADIPACYKSDNIFVSGIGEKAKIMHTIPEMPIVLINPLKPCHTQNVFKSYQGHFDKPVDMPDNFSTPADFIAFLKNQTNSLEKPATGIVDDITNILNSLRYSEGCALSRMSGAGATCFGIFENQQQSQNAQAEICAQNPDWWVKSGIMGQSTRY